MRRIAACVLASFVCAAVAVAYFGGSKPERASAITPTPSWTNTPTVPPTAFRLDLDCDTSLAGIQSSCQFDIGSGVDVAVVLSNFSGSPKQVSSFNFDVLNVDDGSLIPIADSGPNLNSNPDFNNALSGSWGCIVADEDIGAGGPGTSQSRLSCASVPGSHMLANGASVELGRVHYLIPLGAFLGPIFTQPAQRERL
jgi:hypothetical protein